MSNNHSLPLSLAPIGQAVKLISIRAGAQLTHRLTEMGLTPGVELKVMQNTGGPLVVSVRDSRLALGRGMAHKMRVELMYV